MIAKDWMDAIPYFSEGRHERILHKVAELRKKTTVFPAEEDVFAALNAVPFHDVRVVILGKTRIMAQGRRMACHSQCLRAQNFLHHYGISLKRSMLSSTGCET